MKVAAIIFKGAGILYEIVNIFAWASSVYLAFMAVIVLAVATGVVVQVARNGRGKKARWPWGQ